MNPIPAPPFTKGSDAHKLKQGLHFIVLFEWWKFHDLMLFWV